MTNTLPVKVTKAELFTAVKRDVDGIARLIKDAAEGFEKTAQAIHAAHLRIAPNLVLLRSLGATQAATGAATGLDQSTVSRLLKFADGGCNGTTFGPEKRESRMRQIECRIKAETAPEIPEPAALAPVSTEVVEVAPHEDISRSHESVSRSRDDSAKTVAKLQKLGKRVETKINGVRKLLGKARALCDDNTGFEEFKRKYCPSLEKVGAVPETDNSRIRAARLFSPVPDENKPKTVKLKIEKGKAQ